MAKKKSAQTEPRPSQFDAEKLEAASVPPESAAAEMSPAEKSAWSERARVAMRSKLVELTEAELEVMKADLAVSNAKSDHTERKADAEEIRNEFLGMAKDFARGQIRLEFDEPGKPKAPELPFGDDHADLGAIAPVEELSQARSESWIRTKWPPASGETSRLD